MESFSRVAGLMPRLHKGEMFSVSHEREVFPLTPSSEGARSDSLILPHSSFLSGSQLETLPGAYTLLGHCRTSS